MNCVNCDSAMQGPHRQYWYECPECGHLSSNLQPTIGPSVLEGSVHEPSRRAALRELRQRNFEEVLNILDRLRSPHQRKLLDVGCGHGWFLAAAAGRGYDPIGLEPDADIALQARQLTPRVVTGFFPRDVPRDERFDIITFHDVFEHLGCPRAAAAAARGLLNPGGLLAVNLPSSQGALFRTARMLDRAGISGPLDRLWQRRTRSPHLSYFQPGVLSRLLSAVGFRELYRGALLSVVAAGLWARIRYDGSWSTLPSAALWLFLLSSIPLLPHLPPDISFQVFERAEP